MAVKQSSPFRLVPPSLGLLALLAVAAAGGPRTLRADSLDQLLLQLEGDTFADRESAAAEIVSLGTSAIARVVQVTQSQHLESSLRTIHILAEMCLVPEEETWRAAETALMDLVEGPNRTVAFIVQDLLSCREASSEWSLEQLGCKPIKGRSILTLQPDWQGGAHGLVHLRWLPRITSLRIEAADLHPEALWHLRWAPQLRDLVIIDCPVDDHVFQYLHHLPALQHLYLNGTRISDAGLATLQGRKQLSWLEVQATQISDASLPTLLTLQGLKGLRVNGCRISRAGVETLKRELPGVNIWSDD